jgi:predicted NACHT family NTPase
VRKLNADEAKGQAKNLITAIERSERLAELAARPLLLTLMASLHAWRSGSLPEKREELYDATVTLLLDQWENQKVVVDAAGNPVVRQESLLEYLKVDHLVIRRALNQVAFAAHRDQPELNGTADIPQGSLIGVLTDFSQNPDVRPVRLVEYIQNRAGLLAERGQGVYTFPHRTFQEYLAGCHLTEQRYPEEAVSWFKTDPQRWCEAVLLAGSKAARGTPSAVWNLAEELCHKEPPTNEAGEGVEGACWGGAPGGASAARE